MPVIQCLAQLFLELIPNGPILFADIVKSELRFFLLFGFGFYFVFGDFLEQFPELLVELGFPLGPHKFQLRQLDGAHCEFWQRVEDELEEGQQSLVVFLVGFVLLVHVDILRLELAVLACDVSDFFVLLRHHQDQVFLRDCLEGGLWLVFRLRSCGILHRISGH